MKEIISTQNNAATVEQNRVNVVGLRVNVCDYESAIERIFELVKRGNGGYVCAASVHMTMEAHDDREFQDIVNKADLIVPDGKPIAVMQKLLGNKNASQVRGPGLTPRLFSFAEKKSLSVGFYGGKSEVLELMHQRLRADFPHLSINYRFSPPFRRLSAAEDAAIVTEINDSQLDILFVGLGCPKQERWMAEHRDKLNPVMIGVGAAFDFYAGNAAEAPESLQKLGLEWAFRFAQEPRRLWRRYLILNPRFVSLALMQLLGLKKFENCPPKP